MSEALTRLADAARTWGRRGDLSDADRHFASQVSELASFLSRRPFPHEEDLDSVRILGCRLCQRVGAADCCKQQGNCCFGFAKIN